MTDARLPHDPHHRAATEFLRESAGEELAIHALNLAEVLAGGVKAGRGQEMLDDLGAIGTASTLATFDGALAEAARQRHVTVAPSAASDRCGCAFTGLAGPGDCVPSPSTPPGCRRPEPS